MALGVGAAVGVATRLQAGATSEQIGEIFQAIGETVSTEVELPKDVDFANTDPECREVVEKIRQASAGGE